MGGRTLVGLMIAFGGCGGASSQATNSSCVTICGKVNTCGAATGTPAVDCAVECAEGHSLAMLLPAADCGFPPAGQQACVERAVQQSCADYFVEAEACLSCTSVDGNPCSSDDDCQIFHLAYRCDLSRPGGYCTKACGLSADCSFGETCNFSSNAPSFSPQATSSRDWCLHACRSDTDCRKDQGYACLNGGCDIP
jgi:hypothetical protein